MKIKINNKDSHHLYCTDVHPMLHFKSYCGVSTVAERSIKCNQTSHIGIRSGETTNPQAGKVTALKKLIWNENHYRNLIKISRM